MLTEVTLREYLENEYHIKFVVVKNKDGFKVFPAGTNYESFIIVITVKDDIRLTITAEPDKYGRNFLEIINNSTKEKRKLFCEYWTTLGESKISVRINAFPITPKEFIDDQHGWVSFNLRYSVSPYYQEGDNKTLNILQKAASVVGMVLSLVDYSIEGYEEGQKYDVHANKYERNPINRELCLLSKGYKCAVCGFDFEEKYGLIGTKFIEVHHSIPVSEMEEGHVVDPIKELFPVCSNCHSMIHKKEPPYTIDELKTIVEKKYGDR